MSAAASERTTKGPQVDPLNPTNDPLYTELHYAVKAGNIAGVTDLLAAGADANAKTSDGETPLHFATHPDIVRALLAAGADINAIDFFKRCPLSYAVDGGRFDVVNALLEEGAMPDSAHNLSDEIMPRTRRPPGRYSGFSPIEVAVCKRVDLAIVEALLRAGASTYSYNLRKPLIEFASSSKICVLLLVYGFNDTKRFLAPEIFRKAADRVGGPALERHHAAKRSIASGIFEEAASSLGGSASERRYAALAFYIGGHPERLEALRRGIAEGKAKGGDGNVKG